MVGAACVVLVMGSWPHTRSPKSHSWKNKATMVEEGWISIIGKHLKKSPPQLYMTLCSQKKGSKGKF